MQMLKYIAALRRAEQSRAEQSRAEQSRAEQSRAEQSRAVAFFVFKKFYFSGLSPYVVRGEARLFSQLVIIASVFGKNKRFAGVDNHDFT